MAYYFMAKKSAGLLLVLLANILLVAHSILPHQHYGGFALFTAHHFEDHCDPSRIHTEDTDHKHQDHDQACLLQQAYLVPVNASRFACPQVEHQVHYLDFELIFSDMDSCGSFLVFSKIPVPPLLHPGRSPLAVTSCSGLRAPPAL
jgi:hypothetical protein